MALRPWKTLAQTVLARNPWWTYRRDECELPGGKRGEYHYVHTNGSSMIVPVLDDGRLLLVAQYRYLADTVSLEFPCGSVKEGATYEETARHELAEETGYQASSLTLIGRYNPYNGVTDEISNVYLARGLSYTGGTPDETEEFEEHTLEPREIDARIADGTIWDGMTIVAWAFARTRL